MSIISIPLGEPSNTKQSEEHPPSNIESKTDTKATKTYTYMCLVICVLLLLLLSLGFTNLFLLHMYVSITLWFIGTDGERTEVKAPIGQDILTVAIANDIDLEGMICMTRAG